MKRMVARLFYYPYLNMKKQLFSILSLFLFLLGSSDIANAQSQKLIIWQKSGDKVYYNLEENPKVTFSETDMVIATKSFTISYPIEQLLRYTYDITPTSIENTTSNEMRISQKGDAMTFENLKQGCTIQVYSLDGTLVESKLTANERTITVSLGGYPAGVYLIKANGITYKILKR
ncbi:MAG: T9SS type A sorting domain-containing protein [Bacteroidaceae bacterium]|nr:T9SS type A sorting domain-containing protein [Bacteroidaceae bacterium]